MQVNRLKELQYGIAQNDERALKELHSLFCNGLFNQALTITRSRPAAEEIVNDVFVKIWIQRLQLPDIDNLNAYLFTLTRNASLDYLRKISGKRFYSIDETELPILMVNPSPEDRIISTEIINKINQEINKLPPKCRLIFKLVKVDGLKYKEVAGLLGIHVKTVEAQMSIALKKLHTAILLDLPAHTKKTDL